MPASAPAIPSRFRVASGDLMMYLSRMANDIIIRAVVMFAGRVDEQRLRRALRLSLDAEPILGCRFVERWWRPRFQRLEAVDEAGLLKVLAAYGPGDPDATLTRYLLTPFESFDGPLVRAALIRGARDTLCVKLHHLATDGAGTVAYLYRLAELYAALERDPDHAPAPNLASDRSMTRVWGSRPQDARPAEPGRGWPGATDPRWSLNLSNETDGPPAFILRTLPPERFRAVRAYARGQQATVNDVLLAAWYRAVYQYVQPPPRVPLTVATHINLRRHLPAGQAPALANLSQLVSTNIGVALGATLADTVALVQAELARLKNKPPTAGLQSLLAIVPYGWLQRLMQGVAARLAQSGQPIFAGTLFNNVGALDPDRLAMGAPVTNAYLTACVPTGSGLQLVVSTCGEQLNLNVLLREMGNNRQVLETLLDNYAAELARIPEAMNNA